ncbi:hypothetical protein CRT22_23920 [Escherichia sp. E5028]|uniref:hypothetical protein n=1 Tax=Escherichia sp. E5028 TaxID=2044602 RepID=UPI00107FBB1C|nr:hypothetical protein [Escherichia sp. E5028]TGB52858.1 hypothetical protein CRT22_23920 [Escherichia sp. E5028]
MNSNIREVNKCKTVTQKNYIIDDFTNDMILLLPKSPKSFVHILTMALSNVFKFTESEIHASINTIAQAVTQDALNKHLANVKPIPVIDISKRPDIKPEVLDILEHNEVRVAMILVRHLFGDFSETNSEQRKLSEATLISRQGNFITRFRYNNHSFVVQTRFPDCDSSISLI